MPLPQTIQRAIKDNPEINVVLEIAERAREIEGTTPPGELNPTTEVVALPNNRQFAV